MKLSGRPSFVIPFAVCVAASPAAITGVTETNLGGDSPAIIAPAGFAEDALTFSDRSHQHNGAAFDAGGLLSTAGTQIVPLPDYLLGGDYVRFANNARDQEGYSATVTTDIPSEFYLLLDNRINGPAANASSPNSTDPDLGGTFQWVIDGGWERVNTGISPNGQNDYTGVDEGGDAVGAGLGLNQFYAVYRLPGTPTAATVSNNGTGGSNMVSLVVVPAPDMEAPIGAFSATPLVIAEGEAAALNWVINPDSTLAAIDNGVGDVLPETTDGVGEVEVTPSTTTTYTLTVESPEGNDMTEATVSVRLINSFTVSATAVDAGGEVTLAWDTRSDAAIEISRFGEVAMGGGSMMVNLEESTTFTLTASSGAETESAAVAVFVEPAGDLFALLDIGATDGSPEPGALTGAQIGAGVMGTNGTDLATTALVSETGENFTLTIDNIDPAGVPVGGLDWRDRGEGDDFEKWADLGEDLVKNNAGMIRVTLGGLPAGEYDVLSWHFDPTFAQCEAIAILKTDADGVAVDTGVVGSAFANPTVSAELNTTANMIEHLVQYTISSNGVDDVILYFDGRAAVDTEVPINGLQLNLAGPGFQEEIVSVTFDEDAGRVDIEFTSQAGRNYAIFASTDLEDWSDELDDSVEGQEGTTVYSEFGVDTDTFPQRFYRVMRN